MAETASAAMRIHPVILSGGTGSRLWPLSRELYPKQLLPLHTQNSMLLDTALRVHGAGFAPPMIVCNIEHRFIVAEQARDGGVGPQAVVLEPVGRNTAPAVAAAALMLTGEDPEALMLVLPSDHVIADVAAFHRAIAIAAQAAAGGALVTFGITPEGPETGYGYIKRGEPIAGVKGCFKVASFVEKPDLETAKAYVADGLHAWNSGMFLFKAGRFIEELERFRPAILTACRQAIDKGQRDLDFFRLDAEAFTACEADSIDYAVMERTSAAVVVPADFGWSDVGSWSALWEIGEKDGDGNVALGDVMTEDTRDSYLRTEDDILLATVGLRDAIVVVTDDAVLVADKSRAQEVKNIVTQLKSQERSEHRRHRIVYRPWGHYQTVDAGGNFRVNHLMIKPGAKMSLQSHKRRAEHWVIVGGTALVTRDDQHLTMTENQSIYIPVGTRHRLENAGQEPLRVIEVQSGAYLGEDDITRHVDAY